MQKTNFAKSHIQKMKPYSPPLEGRRAYPGALLDFNERVTPISQKIRKALAEFVKEDEIPLYPEYGALKKPLAKYAGVTVDEILVTNGSDQGIDLIFRTFTNKNDRVIIPAPSFAMFFQSAQVMGNRIISPLYRKIDLAFPLKDVLRAIDDKTRLVVICNPNNPTGTTVPLSTVEKVAQKAKNAMVFLDEAYFEFCTITAVPLIQKYQNIVITRTMSKAFGLASLRIGYIIASKTHIAELRKVQGPYDVNMVGYCAAISALADMNSMKRYVMEVMGEAKPLVEAFFKENSIRFFRGGGNFILFKPKNPEWVYDILNENGLRVRPRNQPNIEGTLRLSIGTVEQMKKFISIYQSKIMQL